VTQDLQVARDLQRSQAISGPRRELFRAESLQEQRTLWLGRHTLSLGLPAALSSLASTVLVIAAAALVTFGSYARRVELHGVVLPSTGLVQVTSSVAGWVEALNVRDGDTVASGTPLYTLNTDTATRNGGTQEQILRLLAAQRGVLQLQIERKMRIKDQQDAELRQKIENLAAQIQQMGVQVDVKTEFVHKLTKDFADYTGFVASGIGNLNQKMTQQQNWMRWKDDLEELKSRALRLQAEQIETQARLDRLRLESDNEIDGLRAKLSDIDQQVANSEAKHSITIVSSAAGMVTAISGLPGQVVPAGARMLTIVPAHERMQAELLAPSSSIGFLRPAQRVLLRYSAFPYQKFGQYWGTVTEISRAALQAEELKTLVPTMPPAEQAKTFYRVTVAPDRPDVTAYGRSEPLQASMQVDARVLLDRRPIYQWILEPVFGLRGAYGQS
jgi:membrane fusion protein